MKKISNKDVAVFMKKLKKVVVQVEELSTKRHLKFRLTMESKSGVLENIILTLPTSPSCSWEHNKISQLKRLMRQKNVSTEQVQNLM